MDNNIVLNLPTLSYIVVGCAAFVMTLLVAVIGVLFKLVWGSGKDQLAKIVSTLEKMNENFTSQQLKHVELKGDVNSAKAEAREAKSTSHEAKTTANSAYDMVREIKREYESK